jgi:hypothetical protein
MRIDAGKLKKWFTKLYRYVWKLLLISLLIVVLVPLFISLPPVKKKIINKINREISFRTTGEFTLGNYFYLFPAGISLHHLNFHDDYSDLRIDNLKIGLKKYSGRKNRINASLSLSSANIYLSENTIKNLTPEKKKDHNTKHQKDWIIETDISLDESSFIWVNADTLQVFSGEVQSVGIRDVKLQVSQRTMDWGKIEIKSACASVILAETNKQEIKEKTGWIFRGKKISMQDTYFDLQLLPDKLFLSTDLNYVMIRKSLVNLSDKRIDVQGLTMSDITHAELINAGDSVKKKTGERKSFDWDINLSSAEINNLNFLHSLVGETIVDSSFTSAYLSVTRFNTQVDQAKLSSGEVILSMEDLSVLYNNRFRLNKASVKLRADSNNTSSEINAWLNDTEVRSAIDLKVDYQTLLNASAFPSGKIWIQVDHFIPSELSYFAPGSFDVSGFHDPLTFSLKADIEKNWASVRECIIKVDSLGEISLKGEIDELNDRDSMMFNFNTALIVRPEYLKTYVPDTSSINRFLIHYPVSMQGNIIGNRYSVHTNQKLYSEYLSFPFEASYFFPDSSFQINSGEIRILGDSLFSIPGSILAGSLYAEGDLKQDKYFRTEGNFPEFSVFGQSYSGLAFDAGFENHTLDGNLRIFDSLVRADLHATFNVDSIVDLKIRGGFTYKTDSISSKIHQFSVASDIDLSYSQNGDFRSAKALFSALQSSINNESFHLDTTFIALKEGTNSTRLDFSSDMVESRFQFELSADSIISLAKNVSAHEFNKDSSALITIVSNLPGMSIKAHCESHPLFENILLRDQISFGEFDFEAVSLSGGEKKGILIAHDIRSENLEIATAEVNGKYAEGKMILDADLIGVVRENMISDQYHFRSELKKGYSFNKVRASEGENTRLFLSFEAMKDSASFCLKFTGDTVILTGNHWTINPNNRISFFTDTIYDANLELARGEKRVRLHSIPSCPIQLSAENIDLKPILSIVHTHADISGILNSNICFRNNNFSDVQASLNILNLKIDEEDLGNYRLENTLRLSDESKIDLTGEIFINQTQALDLSGYIDGKSWKKSVLKLSLNDFSLSPVRILTYDIFNELEGNLSGNLVFDGTSEGLWDGNLSYHNLMINPKVVNNRLRFMDNTIVLKDRRIELNKLPIIDEQGKRMLVQGSLDFSTVKDPAVKLSVKTDSMQILNIPDLKDNAIFGRVIASNQLNVSGTFKKPVVGLNLRLIKGTDFTFRITENLSAYEGEGVVYFVSGAEEESENRSIILTTDKQGMEMNAKVIINPEARLRMEYSENMDFDIMLSGNGNISYSGDRSGRESMVGTYSVKQGQAILKLQGLAPKNFVISPSSYLRWDGEVDNPIINIQAVYSVKGSYENPASGMSNTIIVDYDVIFAFKNRLKNPEIVFDLKTQDQYMTTILSNMTEEERVKQAINVLLLGYIVTPETKGSAGKILTDHINQFWAQQLNSAADKSLKGVEVSVDIQSITNYSVGNAQDQTNISYEVKKDIWNDRATVKVGGYVRTYTSSPQDATSRLIGDFSLEYKLDKTENLYAKLFSENKYEGILEGEIQRTGVGLLYRQNYRSMHEIWERRKQTRDKKKVSKNKKPDH